MKKSNRVWRNFLVIVGITLVLAAYFVGREARRVLAIKPSAWVEDQTADCAVVLTGGPGRVREGFDLLSQAAIKKLIISGVHPQAQLQEIFPQWPFYGRLDERDVILEKRSRTTYGNAQQTVPLIEALRCRQLMIVTSALHMHRALKTFRGAIPEDFPIQGRAIVGEERPSIFEVGIEVMKSVFYSLWAY